MEPLKMYFLLKKGDIPASYVSLPEGPSLTWEADLLEDLPALHHLNPAVGSSKADDYAKNDSGKNDFPSYGATQVQGDWVP